MIFRGAPNPTITELDIRFCDFARNELERADITEEPREDLRKALGDIGEKYRTDLDDLCLPPLSLNPLIKSRPTVNT
jgi:hypothetical protein